MVLSLLSRLQAGTLSEMLTVAKLNSLGHAVYVSPESAPGHDIIVVIDGHAKSIEVKTRQFRTSPAQDITGWPVNMTTKGDANFFHLHRAGSQNSHANVYVLTNAQARATFRDYIGGGNCYPPEVRRLITPNDFLALTAQQADAATLASAL